MNQLSGISSYIQMKLVSKPLNFSEYFPDFSLDLAKCNKNLLDDYSFLATD